MPHERRFSAWQVFCHVIVFVEREAFQEIDYRRMFGTMTKWVAQIDRAERIPEYAARMRVPFSEPARQPAPALRRRCRHRHQSKAGGAHPVGRPDPGDRPASRRNDGRRLCIGIATALAYIDDHGLPALIELRYDAGLITPNATLDAIRRMAQAKRRP